ncbi:MAG: lipoprotein [Methylococcales bacterium]
MNADKILLFLCCTVLVGCGQPGPLYLPSKAAAIHVEPEPAAQPQPVTQPEPPAKEE